VRERVVLEQAEAAMVGLERGLPGPDHIDGT